MSAALLGARVSRVDVLAGRALALGLKAKSVRGTLVCSAERGASGLGLLASRPSEKTIDASLLHAESLLRAHLEGARLLELSHVGTTLVWLGFEREEQRSWLALMTRGHGAITLCDHTLVPICSLGDARARLTLDAREPYDPAETLEELGADGRDLLASLTALALERARARAEKALRAAQARLSRKLEAIASDQSRHAEAGALRTDATLLLRYLHSLPRGQHEITLLDDSVEPPLERRLRIDPALGPARQADTWFARAKKLDRGVSIAKQREQRTRADLAALDTLQSDVRNSRTLAELAGLTERARSLGVLLEPAAGPHTKKRTRGRVPYREFRGAGDRPIFVGRGAADNDELTLRHARPHDLWLHARDASGAHVVVPLGRGEACPPELLCDAATLAAHFSSARGEQRVDVCYVERRYVQKPRKSAPGLVRLVRERVFHLEHEPTRLARLLAAEWAPLA